MPRTLEDVQQDIEEMEALEGKADRVHVKDILQIELKKLQTEMSLIKENLIKENLIKDETKTNTTANSQNRCVTINLSTYAISIFLVDSKMPMTPAERKRISRQRIKDRLSEAEAESAMEKERDRIAKAVKQSRENKRKSMTPADLKAHKESESKRVSDVQYKKRCAQREREKAAEALISIAKKSPAQPYRTRQSYSKAMNTANAALPVSPRKRAAVVSGLASQVGLRMENTFSRRLVASAKEELRDYVKAFYYRADISYTAPGMKDEMTIWDEKGKQRMRKYYLTMFLREAYSVFIATADPEFHCSRSVFCALRPQNVLLVSDSPKEQCKCQTHENFFFKLEAMGHSYDDSFWETILCDVTPNSRCWLNACEDCKGGAKFVPLKELTAVTTYKQWATIEVESRKSKRQQEKVEAGKSTTYTKLVQSVKEVQVQEVLSEFTEEFESVTKHVNTKRIQAKEFQDDLSNPSVRVLQIDYAMAYQCENQHEVYGALWTRGSVNLFTNALYHKGATTTSVYCTNYKGKDKWCNGIAIENIYETNPTTDEISEEIIWSDGPVSEFKNQFMALLISYLSIKYGKPFTWKFSATAHGKGVVDGIGGRVKSLVRMKTMSLGGKHRAVQNAHDFVALASQLCENISVRLFTIDQIECYQAKDRFKHGKAVSGISSVHVMRAEGASLLLWENSQNQANGDPPLRCEFSHPAPAPVIDDHCAVSYMDVVEITTDPYKGYYAVIVGSVGDDLDEIKINYLKKSGGRLLMVPNDTDMRPMSDFKRAPAKIDGNSRYFAAYLEE